MKYVILIILSALAFLVYAAAYTVDETEQVVVTQFGKPMGAPKRDPGLYFKIPLVQKANYFPKHLLEWDGDPGQVPTLDKTYLYVDPFARWKVVEPLRFFQTTRTVAGAQSRLDDILDAAVRNVITSYPLIETVRITNRELGTFETGADIERRPLGTITLGRPEITEKIFEQAAPKLKKFGIQLVDVKIKRINYVEKVRESVYARMIAERKQIAEKFRAEGKGEARRIEGKRDKELQRIRSEAYRKAQKIKGNADAEATRIYARAYGKNPGFYSFVNTLKVYRETLDKDSTLVLSTDSEFFRFFKGYREQSMKRAQEVRNGS